MNVTGFLNDMYDGRLVSSIYQFYEVSWNNFFMLPVFLMLLISIFIATRDLSITGWAGIVMGITFVANSDFMGLIPNNFSTLFIYLLVTMSIGVMFYSLGNKVNK
jgi:hypothetical protein